jgi:hypothetical protein
VDADDRLWSLGSVTDDRCLESPRSGPHSSCLPSGAYSRGRSSYGAKQSGGPTGKHDTPFGTWQNRFIDWYRDLGFLGKPGVETRAARDVAGYASRSPRN